MKMVSPQGETLDIPGPGARALEALGWERVDGPPAEPKRRGPSRRKASDADEEE